MVKRFTEEVQAAWYTFLVRHSCRACLGALRVNQRSRVNKQTTLGHNVNFNGLIISGEGAVTIGDNFHCGIDCLLMTQNHRYDDGNAIPYDTEASICKRIVIEDNVWLGSRVLIVGQVTIGEGSIVQAGSVVVSNVPKYAIVGGNPARQFKTRDVEHYEALKAARQFC